MKEESYLDLFKVLVMDGMTTLREFTGHYLNRDLNEPYEIGVVAGVALFSCFFSCFILYCLCCSRKDRRRAKKVRVFGRIKEITIYPGGGARKRTAHVDPFRLTNSDFQRRFEDEVAQFLYLLGSDCINGNKKIHIVFFDTDGKRNDNKQYHLNYQWLLRHFAANSREYAHALIDSSCKRHEVLEARNPGWSSSEVLYELKSSGIGQNRVSSDLIVSWACQVHDLCQSLRERSNKRISGGGHLQEAVEGEASARLRESVTGAMSESMILVELIKEAISPLPKSLKDHYYNLTSMQRIYCEEFIPFVDVSRCNKRRLGKMEDTEETRDIIQGIMEEIVNKGGDDVLEMMATAVLPRFNHSIELY